MNGAASDDDRDLPTEFTLGKGAATLTVRAWLDPVAGGTPILRGTVSVTGKQMLGAFDSLETLAAIVERHVARSQE